MNLPARDEKPVPDRGALPLAARVDLAARFARLFAWLAMCVAISLAIWMLARRAAEAAGPQADPRAAAREIGRAGALAAAATARDPAAAAATPGYAGVDLPERNLRGASMAAAGRARLADPDDPGGAAGRAAAAGYAARTAAPDPRGDAGVARANAIQAAPNAPAHRADGLASGAAADCGAEVGDAGRGGACGGASWCVGADCGAVEAQAGAGFFRAAASLNLALETGGAGFDRRRAAFFPGERRACRTRLGGLADCCADRGPAAAFARCPVREREIARARDEGRARYLGERCARRVLGACLTRERTWCVFGSKLGRMLHEQARPRLGVGWRSCRGFSAGEIGRIDFDRLDLSEFYRELADPDRAPGVVPPDRDAVRAGMRDRLRALAGGDP